MNSKAYKTAKKHRARRKAMKTRAHAAYDAGAGLRAERKKRKAEKRKAARKTVKPVGPVSASISFDIGEIPVPKKIVKKKRTKIIKRKKTRRTPKE